MRFLAPAALATLLSSTAFAAAADCKVHSIEASSKPGGVDPKLASIKAKLATLKYQSFKLVATDDAAPQAGKPATVKLANGKALTLSLLEAGKTGARGWSRLAADIPPKVKSLKWKANDGNPFLIVLDGYQGGALVAAIVCTAK